MTLSKGSLYLVAAGTLGLHADIVGYVNNPTGNSVDFASGVASHGGGAITTLDFNSHPFGVLQSNFYTGVTLTFGSGASVNNGYDATVGATDPPLSNAEGLHDGSNHITPVGTRIRFVLNFDSPVMAAGFFVIDLHNPSGVNPATFTAFEGPGGTGPAIGSIFNAAGFNFELNHQYFMGILSSTQNIQSIVFTANGDGNDSIEIDDIKYARIGLAATPEPSAVAMFLIGTAALGLLGRRKARTR
jgi:PEP-CTERM motif